MYNPSTPSNSKSLKQFQTYTLGSLLLAFPRAFICAVFRSFLERSEKLCQTKLINNEL